MNENLSNHAAKGPGSMETELRLRIVVEKPPPGTDFGLQEGKGRDYKTVEKQRSKGKNLTFTCTVMVKDNREDGLPNFLGPMAQGPSGDRFLYLDIGQYAGQKDSPWSRRLKVSYFFFPSLNRSSIIGVSAGRGMRFKSTISPSTTNSM
jgi:Family of unknown function (DUF5990)